MGSIAHRLVSIVVLLLVAGIAVPASAKVICPPGRFVIQPLGAPRMAALDGRELVLGRGRASVTEMCRSVRARGFHRVAGRWGFSVQAQWRRCGGHPLALRARFTLTDAPYCTRLAGTMRLGKGRPVAFVAERVPECGNGIRDVGEKCDELANPNCCAADCGPKPGCLAVCDPRTPCDDGDVCAYTCGQGGRCVPRAQVHCGGWPVCACDEVTEFVDRCAAYAAGMGVAYAGPCRRSCTPLDTSACRERETCLPDPAFAECERWKHGFVVGRCAALPYGCADKADEPVCGCDGTTYRNRCELTYGGTAAAYLGACR